MISDHLLSSSGVATSGRWLVNGLLATGKYSFYCFGAALRHENLDNVKVSDDFIIKPINGFGDKNLIRTALLQIKPDAVMLFTDPRFFNHIWNAENEIHQVCPITYWTIWDARPTPRFNDPIYASCDLLNCINYPTYEMISEKFSDRTNYIPHGVPAELYSPLPQHEQIDWKIKLLGPERKDHLVALFVSRNARRKNPSDLIMSWKIFCDELEKKHGHRKATLLMHTDPLDPEGPNLHAVIDMLKMKDNVVFSKDRTGFAEMKVIYNIADFVVSCSAAEGFGLSLLEGKMCGKPVVAIKTGGMTRQVEDHITGDHYGIGLNPEVEILVGNQQIPYIMEDYVSHKTYSDAYMKMYEMGDENRRVLGRKALAHAHREYNVSDVVQKWDETLSDTIEKWNLKQLPNNKRWHIETL